MAEYFVTKVENCDKHSGKNDDLDCACAGTGEITSSVPLVDVLKIITNESVNVHSVSRTEALIRKGARIDGMPINFEHRRY